MIQTSRFIHRHKLYNFALSSTVIEYFLKDKGTKYKPFHLKIAPSNIYNHMIKKALLLGYDEDNLWQLFVNRRIINNVFCIKPDVEMMFHCRDFHKKRRLLPARTATSYFNAIKDLIERDISIWEGWTKISPQERSSIFIWSSIIQSPFYTSMIYEKIRL